jgi:hypothetical protein
MAVLSNVPGSSISGPGAEEFLLHENSRTNKPAIKKVPLVNPLDHAHFISIHLKTKPGSVFFASGRMPMLYYFTLPATGHMLF